MKKSVLILIALMLCLSVISASAEVLPKMTNTTSRVYNNEYLGYSLRVPNWLYKVPDETDQLMLKEYQDSGDEEGDRVYDVRFWVVQVTEDDYLEFSVQIKERTYESFEIEKQMASEYARINNEDLQKQGISGHYEMIHDGILRETPMGEMLETACTYTDENGKVTSMVYYDFYFNTVEYCFTLQSGAVPFEEMQQLLYDMMQTVNVETVLEEA